MKRWVVWLALLCSTTYAVAQDKIIVSGASGQLGSLVIDELLAEACTHYPLEVHRDERYRAIAPRVA